MSGINLRPAEEQHSSGDDTHSPVPPCSPAFLFHDDAPLVIENPLVSTFPCHSQTVEHGVALTSACVKRRRKEENQVMSTLQTAQARRVQPGRTTYASVAASDAIKRT